METLHVRSLNAYLRERFGEKVYKLALDGGFTCPTRDGTLDTRGCIFCAGGSGAFTVPVGKDVHTAIEQAKTLVADKGGKKYIAYYQSYTGTYAPLERLRALYTETLSHPDVVALSIGTRPDCLPEEVVALLKELNAVKPVWVELGLQTAHDDTAKRVNRGYDLGCFEAAYARLKAAGLTVILHLIFGLPGESREDMLDSVRYIAALKPQADGVKLQMLHVLKGTELARQYEEKPFPLLSMEEYTDLIAESVRILPENMVIHRMTGDGPRKLLIAPLWTTDKKRVLNTLRRKLANTVPNREKEDRRP